MKVYMALFQTNYYDIVTMIKTVTIILKYNLQGSLIAERFAM